jgi:hypothetical protein
VGHATHVCRLNVDGMELLAAGDYLELQVFQDSGGDLTSSAASDSAPRFGAMLMR